MNFKQIISKSWQNVWHYKALWLFGMLVALTAASDLIMFPLGNTDGVSNNLVKFTDEFVVHLPGEGLIVDFTQPEGMRIILTDGPTAYELHQLSEWSGVNYLSEIEAVGVTILSLFLAFVLISMLGHYVAQTALIRMVDETERSDSRLTFFQGLRLGFSNRALRVFLLDLIFALAVIGTFALEIYLTILTFETVDKFGELVVFLTAFGIAGMLFTTLMLFVILGFLFSVIKPNVRRAIAIDNKGIFNALSKGLSLLKNNFKEVGVTWLIWMGTRILWVPVSILVLILMAPLLIIFLMAGLVVGAVPGLMAAGIANLFVNWVGALIIGVVVGTPTLILVTVLPFLVVKGWVEIFKSSLWTYEYGAISSKESEVPVVEQKEPARKPAKLANEQAA